MENFKGHSAGKMGYLEFRFNPDDVFVKIDRSSSRFNLKVMTPFLDTRLVEFAFNKIPADMKIRNGTKKYILKKLANKYLPPELPLDRKKGFNPPLSVWLKKQLFSDVRDYLLSGDEIFFKRAYVEKLISKNTSAWHDVSKKIFVLLMFKIWERNYLTGN
ncbi:asparagine synthase C-terminal domain-containing protein [Desulfobacterota bacterium AH_259_B03_O07]|nr:asparagine synthase C-terminal domain-containing protein [Desulfobacterota bacterium AH_259_B03_O07]